MKKLFLALAVVGFFGTGTAKADHCVDQVKGVAHGLDKAAAHLTQTLRSMGVAAYIQDTADDLARATSHLHHMAHSAASCRHLQRDFREVEHAMEHFLDHFRDDHSLHHNPHVLRHVSEINDLMARTEAALGGGGFPPPIGLITEQVRLGSSRYRYNEVILPGAITNVALVAQHSSARCVQGRTFGFRGNALWVDRGCQGTFSVTRYAR